MLENYNFITWRCNQKIKTSIFFLAGVYIWKNKFYLHYLIEKKNEFYVWLLKVLRTYYLKFKELIIILNYIIYYLKDSLICVFVESTIFFKDSFLVFL